MNQVNSTCLLSIVVPFYNNETHLHACLTSLFEQLGDDIEVVLINDGSTDHSQDVVQQLVHHYQPHRIITLTQKNGGIACARNVGLQHASGQYITFLDGDDLLSQHYLSTLRPLLQSHRYQLIDFEYAKFTDEIPEDTPPTTLCCSEYAFQQQGKACLIPLFERAMWHVWSRVFHRSLLAGESFAVGRRYEDVIFTPFIYFKTQKIAHLGHKLYFYRDNQLGITRNVREEDIADILFAIQRMLNFSTTYHHDPVMRQLAAMMILNCFNELKSMSRQVYGYYFYPAKVKTVLKQAAELCRHTTTPKKKIWQMQYPLVDTLLSKIRWKLNP